MNVVRASVFFVYIISISPVIIAQSEFMEAISSPIKLYSDNTDGFVVIGHRGASAYYPENTMTAFKAALEMGAEMIELDILLSKDGVPVVIHDETLNRTTNSQGLVNEYTADELQAMDAGSWFAPAFAGEPIPTLEDVLAFAKGKIAVNIEIKTEAVTDVVGGGIEQKSLELVKQFGMEEYVLFSSFDYRAIAHLRELDDDVATALLYEKKQSGNKTPVQLVSEYKANAFNCSYRQFNKKRASKLRAHNIPVFVYTVNKEKRMRKLIKKGVTGIFSDKPDLLSRLVDNMWENN